MWDISESLIRTELKPSERLLWSGQPRQGIILSSADAFKIPFGLLAGGLYLAAEVAKFVPFLFKLGGILFIIHWLYGTLGKYIVDAKKRSQTYYGITDKRIIIVSGLLKRKVESFNLERLSDISLNERPDGSGTIIFGPNAGSWWDRDLAMPRSPSFEKIQWANNVYKIIQTAQRQAS